MENRINIAELLKDCPKGMELDCVMYENLYFDYIDNNKIYPIYCYTEDNLKAKHPINFTWYGRPSQHDSAKCVIFPKNRTTWEGFVPPCKFKDGDIVATQGGEWLGITKNETSCGMFNMHCAVNCIYHNEFHTIGEYCFSRFATEEEKEKLFDTIKANGYKWNSETKTLEKLIEPKFKIGDRIRITGTTGVYVVTEVREHYYIIDDKDMRVYFTNQYQWELALNKFDITTLKPFESRVLVRDNKTETWKPAYWGFYDETNNVSYPYVIVGGSIYGMSIPYENNEHLLGTTDDCDEFYKTW